MRNDYKKEAIEALAVEIMAAGFRVFIAERGHYGFYTDEAGSCVVSFQYDLGGVSFSGNYRTESPRTTGTGWGLESGTFANRFNQSAPRWATNGFSWKYTTLAQHLALYQASSRYTELQPESAQ